MVNILILAAGAGSRFANAGYNDPKPFIPLNTKRPMIEEVVKNLKGTKHTSEFKFIIVVQKKFLDEYGKKLNDILKENCFSYELRTVDGLTSGSAATALTVSDIINTNEELILTDTDHLCLDKDHIFNGVSFFRKRQANGGLWVFHGTDSKYSFVRVDDQGKIIDVREKEPISTTANVGSYYWQKGSDYVRYAKEMINKNDKVLGEHYLAPVYKYAILDGFKILPFFVNEFWSLGTPQLLQQYLTSNK